MDKTMKKIVYGFIVLISVIERFIHIFNYKNNGVIFFEPERFKSNRDS